MNAAYGTHALSSRGAQGEDPSPVAKFHARVDRVEAILTAIGVKYRTCRYWCVDDWDGACVRIPLSQFECEKRPSAIYQILKEVNEEDFFISDEELVFYIPREE